MGGQELQKEENCLKTYGLCEVRKCILFYVLYVLVAYHLITLCFCHFRAFQLEILMRERDSKPPQVLVVIIVVAAPAEK
jgi:hypothetical protein